MPDIGCAVGFLSFEAERCGAREVIGIDSFPDSGDSSVRGVLVEDMGQTYLTEPDAHGDEARTLQPLQAAAITYRIAFGPRAGQKVLTLRGTTPRESAARQPLCADIDGFSLHAAVLVEAHDRKRLGQMCRYITRPAQAIGAKSQRGREASAEVEDGVV